MRSLRPPPRVTPPKPPAHLFEPREEMAPVRLENKLEKAYAYEDDVKFQMQQLEEEMRQILAKETGAGAPMMPERNPRQSEPPARAPVAPKRPGGDPFATAINPSDWKKNGFPSEFAYMKAMGQLEISNGPPSVLNAAPKISLATAAPSAAPPQRLRMDDIDSTSGPNRMTDKLQEREREMVSPARRKGGAIQNLYNDEENLRRKFASQHEYSDQLQRQANEQRLARESEVMEHRGLQQQQRQTAGRQVGEDTGGMRFPSEQGGAKPNRAPPQQWPAPAEGRFASAPPQRPEASLPRGQMPPDYAEPRRDPRDSRYGGAPDPYQRGDPSRDPRQAPPQQWGPEGMRGGAPPRQAEQYPAPTRQPVDSPPRKAKNEPANTSLALGMDKQSELALKRAKQEEYRRQLDSLGGRQQPQEVASAASLALGMDKQSELALKRAKQEEYKRQLDSLKPRQEVIPAARSAVVDSNSYLHTGVRPAQPRAPVAGGDAYHSSLPPQRSVAAPAPSVGAMTSYPDSYRGAGMGASYDDVAGRYAHANHMDRVRDPHNAPLQVRNQGDHARYLESAVPMDEASGHYAEVNHLDRFRDTHDAPVQVRNQMDHLASNRRFDPAPAPRLMDPRLDPYSEESKYRAFLEAQQRREADLYAPPPGASMQNPGGYNAPAAQAPARGAPHDPKEAKRLQQEEYRRELERQMQEKQALKEKSKKQAEVEDEKFLRSLGEAEPDANSRRKKGQAGQQPAKQAPPEPSRRVEAPPPQAAAQRRPDPVDSRYEDDVAAEYAYMKAKGLLPPGDFRDPDPSDRWESQSNDRYDDRSGYGGDGGLRRPPADYRADGAPGRNDRGMSVDTEDPSHHAALSPSKSPNQARARFMKDIYGGDLISHDPERSNAPGAVGGPGWKPSAGGVDERKRQVILEQKAALDLQKAANEARRKKEKEDEEEKDRKKEERERAEQERIDEEKRLEKKKKDDFNAESARDLAQLQEKRTEEALARKGRGRKPPTESETPQQAAPPPKVNRGGPEPDKRRIPEYDSPPREDYEHINSPVRDAIRQHAMMQMEQQNQSYARGPPPQMSLYQAPPVDMVDSFVRNYRPDPYQGEPLPPPGYGARPPYAGAPYGSYDREAAPYQQYPAPYPPPQQQYPPQRYGQPQYPPMQLQRGNFYPDQNPDVSLVSESRLIPNNPWSSSDILSSLVPIGARAAQAANAAAESQARQYAGRAPSDLEKSLASESEFIYLGRRTPAANENPRAKAAAGLATSQAELPRSSRPIASPANAQLADLIAETNRMIAQETAQASMPASVQTKEVAGASGKRASPQLNADGSPKNRLKSSGFGEYQLGDNDGISTVARQDSRSRFIDGIGDVLEDIPPAKNRIFLGQKPDYDESLARDSVDSGSVPIKVMMRGSHMSTQTSTPNLLQLPVPAQSSSPEPKQKHSARGSAESSPRTDETPRSKARRHSSFVTTGKSSRSPRSHHRHRHHSPDRTDEDMQSTPLDPMRAEAAISPMKPVRATSAGSHRALPGEGGDLAEMIRRDALGSPPSAAKGVGKKSPRQRALDNKAIRESTGGAPRTKFPEPEPEPEEMEIPEYSRPRRNVLNANEGVVSAPGAYKSPRQRALERQLQKNAALGADAPAQEIAEDEPIADESQYQAEDAGAMEAEVEQASAAGGYENVDELPDEVPASESLFHQQNEMATSEYYDEYPQEVVEDPAPYVAQSAEELYGDEYAEAESVSPRAAYDESEGYVVPSAEDMYGEEQYQPEGAEDPEPYVAQSAEELYGDGYAEETLPPREYDDAEPYVVPSAEDMYGEEYAYEDAPAENIEQPGAYEVGSAEDLYGGGEYEVEQVPLEDDGDGSGGYVVASAEETYGGRNDGEIEDAADGESYLDQDHAQDFPSDAAAHDEGEVHGRSPRKNVLNAAGDLLKPSADHRSPRQRALDNKAIREAAGVAKVSPRTNIAPYAPPEEEEVEPEHVRQRKNVLNANEAIIRPAVNQQWSPRGRVAAHHSAGDEGHAASQSEEHPFTKSRPTSGNSSTVGDHTFSRNVAPDQSLDAFLGEIDRVVARAQSITLSRPASGRPRTGGVPEVADASGYADYLDSLAPRVPSRPASGRPRSGRSRVSSSAEYSLAADNSASGASRPASGRPRTGIRAEPSEEPVEAAPSRPRTGTQVRDYESIGGDALDAAVAHSVPSSRPASGGPLTSRQASQPVSGDVLDEAIAVADKAPSRPASGRPRTSQAAVPQDANTDVLDREMSLGALAIGSRPASSRPMTGKSTRGATAVEEDALDRAVSNSRPSTGHRHTEA